MKVEEAIENLKNEEIPRLGKDGFPNDNLIKAHLMAIQSLELQSKLKTWIENLKTMDCFTTDNQGVIDILDEFLIDEV